MENFSILSAKVDFPVAYLEFSLLATAHDCENVLLVWLILQEVWTAQPVVAALMFGLPALLFCFLIYTLCIADTGEEYEEEFDENEEEEIDEERPVADLEPASQAPEKPKME